MREKADLLKYERELKAKGFELIAGMDEVGRGPLAGPVTVACCIMDIDRLIEGVDDSKKLSEKKRELLNEKIKEAAIGYKIVSLSHEEIDELNILNATKKAMREAVNEIFPKPEFLLVDAVKDDFGVQYMPIIHGDALSYSIAAASILAKVYRDRLMAEYARIYPQYGFERNKGYGTKEHIEALRKFGPCPIHRKSFIKNLI